MQRIKGLIIHNLKKEKGQYVSFGMIILLTAFILNLAVVLLFQVDRAYDKKFTDLDTANLNFCIPAVQTEKALADEFAELPGVSDLEIREGILTEAVIEEFRDVDFTIRTMFYNMDEARRLNRFKIVEESKEDYERPIYIPLFVAQFGQFKTGEYITYRIGAQSYTFRVAGIVEEMQYGNAGSGIMGAYLPEETYQKLADENTGNKVTEYSLVTKEGTDLQKLSNDISSMLADKKIGLLSDVNSDSSKQVRTMVCSLVILILTVFALVVLLVSMSLCRFRIQNTVEEEMSNMGVLKAMGYTSRMIMGSCILPYMITGTLAALIGVLLSYALLPVLAEALALQSGFSFVLHFDPAALVVTLALLLVITLLFTYIAARRIKSLQPILAIRGSSESRHGRRNYFPLDRMAGSIRINLVLKQVAASAKQNILLFVVSFFVMVLMAFAGTLFYNVAIEPDNFTRTLSEETPSVILGVYEGRMQAFKDKLEDEPGIERMLEYATSTANAEHGNITAFICEDYSRVSSDLCYRGRNPVEADEIALGSAWDGKYEIGDRIELTRDQDAYTYEIVGFVQSVNYQGEICELTQEGWRKMDSHYEPMSLYLYLEEQADVEQFIETLEENYGEDIASSVNYDKMTRVSQDMYQGTVRTIIAAVFAVTVLIMLLVFYIVIRSMIVRRKQEFGIYKAMGYSSAQLRRQLSGSFLPVSALACLISAAAGLWYMPAINQVIFGMLGAMKNYFKVSLLFLLLFAVLQILVNFVISMWLSRPIRKITAYSLIKE